MRLGINLPQIGPGSSPQLFVEAAQRAEALGYDSVWVWERLLAPIDPQTPYPGSPDGRLPHSCAYQWDPVTLLGFVAAHTRRVALGTSVLDIPFYNPVMLARALATLDVVSDGRLRLGLGLGWSKDELDAVGAKLEERGPRADEFLQVLQAVWTQDPVEFQGRYYRVPRSSVAIKPAQKPHPPIYLATFVKAGLERIARHADGWNPVLLPAEVLTAMMGQVRAMAASHGRDPRSLKLVVRGNLSLSERPLPEGRALFAGSLEQIRADAARVRELGADELLVDPTFTTPLLTPKGYLALMEQIRGAL